MESPRPSRVPAQSTHESSSTRYTVSVRLLADAALVAILMFSAAGTLSWWRGWILLAVLLAVRGVGAVAVARVNPALLRDRARLPIHADQPASDRVLLLSVLATGFLGLPVIAALDVFHWHLLPRPAQFLGAIGLVLFALGWSLKSLALHANAFATTVVRVQNEVAHTIVDSGVYALVRHPFYAADPLILVGIGLWLQSSLAVFCAVIPVVLMLVRMRLEEQFLRRAFPEYSDYVMRVPYRLFPGVW